MAVGDIDAVAEMEKLVFTLPWSRDAFRRELEENVVARYLVLEERGRILAYGGIWLVIDEAHLTNVAVHPQARGRGFGERLVRALMRLASDTCMGMITLEVRRSNAAAQALYRKVGFEDVGYRKRYYEDNQEDALIMYAPLPLADGE
ncbi:MAG: ribosomal protein S18-alanine N-acetyltransferase [Clostridia bacterium]|nr:ribosomal protein S18-alanine N-acetyltransferase [Clostridia bacterium]